MRLPDLSVQWDPVGRPHRLDLLGLAYRVHPSALAAQPGRVGQSDRSGRSDQLVPAKDSGRDNNNLVEIDSKEQPPLLYEIQFILCGNPPCGACQSLKENSIAKNPI